MRSANIFVAQLNDTGQPRRPQRYNGQRFTLQSSTNSMNLSWRADKLGLPNTTVTAGVVAFASSLRLNAPNTIRLRTLSVHQRPFVGKLEIKAGYLSNVYEYVGLFTSGGPVLAAGLGGLIPIQAGLSGDPVAAPGVNVTIHGQRGLYAKAGIQRSVSPFGRPFEIEATPGGFQFGAPGAGVFEDCRSRHSATRWPAKSSDVGAGRSAPQCFSFHPFRRPRHFVEQSHLRRR